MRLMGLFLAVCFVCLIGCAGSDIDEAEQDTFNSTLDDGCQNPGVIDQTIGLNDDLRAEFPVWIPTNSCREFNFDSDGVQGRLYLFFSNDSEMIYTVLGRQEVIDFRSYSQGNKTVYDMLLTDGTEPKVVIHNDGLEVAEVVLNFDFECTANCFSSRDDE